MILLSLAEALNTRQLFHFTFGLLFLVLSSQTLAYLYNINLFEALQILHAEGWKPTYTILENKGLNAGSLITYKFYTAAAYFIGIPIGILIAMRTIATSNLQRVLLVFIGILLIVDLRFTGYGFIYQELLLKTPGRFFDSLFLYLLLVGIIQLIIGLLILLKKRKKVRFD
ncbi:MAG: hypothetical protein V4717_05650 [Bacteroidota bacterium]